MRRQIECSQNDRVSWHGPARILAAVRKAPLSDVPALCGVNQSHEHRVRRTFRGAQLRLVQSAYEERVVEAFNRSDLAGGVSGSNAHPMRGGDELNFGRQPVRACGALDGSWTPMQLRQERSRREIDGDGLVLERAGKERDYRRAAGSVFGVRRVRDPRQAASVLDQHVLKPASSTDQGHPALARHPHRRKHGLGIAVGAPGPNHHRLSQSEAIDVTDLVGRDDSDLDRNRRVLRRMAERCYRGGVVVRVGWQIHQHGDDGRAHR
jgi:hypothetical protein